MRPGQNKRMRGRNNNRKGPNPLTRAYESNGPDVKVRGTAQHIAEKYLQLARDAQSSGDPVMAESYLQHAEHYYRLIAAAMAAQQALLPPQPGQPPRPTPEAEFDDDEDDVINDRFASPEPMQRFTQPQAQGGEGFGNDSDEGEQQAAPAPQPVAAASEAATGEDGAPAQAAGEGEGRRHRDRNRRRRGQARCYRCSGGARGRGDNREWPAVHRQRNGHRSKTTEGPDRGRALHRLSGQRDRLRQLAPAQSAV
jgi:hypothetical protein